MGLSLRMSALSLTVRGGDGGLSALDAPSLVLSGGRGPNASAWDSLPTENLAFPGDGEVEDSLVVTP